jgi:hypothetical protein
MHAAHFAKRRAAFSSTHHLKNFRRKAAVFDRGREPEPKGMRNGRRQWRGDMLCSCVIIELPFVFLLDKQKTPQQFDRLYFFPANIPNSLSRP